MVPLETDFTKTGSAHKEGRNGKVAPLILLRKFRISGAFKDSLFVLTELDSNKL